MSEEHVVLGAGLAGAGAARQLPGARVFEAEPEPGGYARSHEFAGAWFDCGAHICHSRDEAWLSLVTGHAPLHEMAESRVLNHKAGRWFAYPVQNHLCDLPEDECRRALDDFLAAQERYRGQEPRNYEEWCRFQYGDHLLENYYRLYTAKYWHEPMDRLATDWLGGRLLPSQVEMVLAGAKGEQVEKQAVFSRFRYPREGGFFALVRHLFDGLRISFGKKAIEINPSAKTIQFADGTVEGFGELISTIPLPELVRIIKDVPPSVTEAAGKLKHLRHYCVNILVERESLTDANWFYVYDPDIPAARVSFPFSLTGQRIGRTAVQAEVFRPGDDRPDADAILNQTLSDMGKLLDFRPSDIAASEICCQPVSYVVSDLDRAPAVHHILDWLSTRRIRTAGLFGNWSYIWSDRAYSSGVAATRGLSAGK